MLTSLDNSFYCLYRSYDLLDYYRHDEIRFGLRELVKSKIEIDFM